MPFQILRNDISLMYADAIVNTANPQPIVGAGTDSAIHDKAGPRLLEARKVLGPIRPGHSAITPAFGLNARYVIHTVGPVWRGGIFGEEKTLRSCYESALALALEYGCNSIAFPLISTGTYRFPKNKAMQIALSVFSEFLTEHDMQIFLVVYDKDAFRLSEKLFRDVTSYIDEHYVELHTIREPRFRARQQIPDWWDADPDSPFIPDQCPVSDFTCSCGATEEVPADPPPMPEPSMSPAPPAAKRNSPPA